MKPLFRRTIHPVVRVLDSAKGIVEYVASDETLDSYREVIRSKGWRFDLFKKNAPFVDSHNYDSLDQLVGKVIDFSVKDGKLVEVAQWAIDVAENKLAQLGWKMTEAGYLKAVSVGFFPVKYVSRFEADKQGEFSVQLQELGLTDNDRVHTIYTDQQQIELSACIIGANPNALAKAYKAGVLDDPALEFLSHEYSLREPVPAADTRADAAETQQRAREDFLRKLHTIINKL